jgi:hypothetical protein
MEHIRSQIKTDCFHINPEGKFKKFWTIIVICLLFYTATIMPYKLAMFSKDDGKFWFYLDTSIDVLFLIDIYINLNTPLEISDGEYEYNRCKIFISYLKFWLLIDLFSSIPTGIIEKILVPEEGADLNFNNNDLLRVARIPRLYKLLRMSRLVKILKVFKKSLIFQKIRDFF